MKYVKKLTTQIIDVEKMIVSTNLLLSQHIDDPTLIFMLEQDKHLVKTLKQKRTQKLLSYLKESNSSIDTIFSDIFTVIPFQIDPTMIAREMGIKLIKNVSIGDDVAGKCYIEDEIIIEYKPASSNRDRFTISHELAHVIKHMPYRTANNTSFQDSSEMLYARNDHVDSSDPIESEADTIAGNILVPLSNVEKLINSLEPLEKLSTKLLCDLFKVSEGAIYHALKNYNLLYSPSIKQEFSWSIQSQ